MKPRVYKIENLAPLRIDRAGLHEMAATFIEAEFDRRGEVPFLWLIAAQNTVLWVETPWESEREKSMYASVMASMMNMLKAHAYAQILEAWVAVELPDENGNLRADAPLPSERPEKERDDIVAIFSFDAEGGYGTTRYLVSLRPPPKKNRLGLRVDENYEFTGRFSNLLRRKTV